MDFSQVFTDVDSQIGGMDDNGGGGGKFTVPESGVYGATITRGYFIQNKNHKDNTDAVVEMVLANGFEWKLMMYKALYKQSPYKDASDKSKGFLYGFDQMLRICVCATGKTLEQLQNRITVSDVPVWNYAKSKDILEPANVVNDMAGAKFLAGLTRKVSNKQDKDSSGTYVNTPERKLEAVMQTQANVDEFTFTEIHQQATDPKKLAVWEKTHAGVDWDAYITMGAGGKQGNGNVGDRKNRF